MTTSFAISFIIFIMMLASMWLYAGVFRVRMAEVRE